MNQKTLGKALKSIATSRYPDKQVGGQEPQKTEQREEFEAALRYVLKDYQQQIGNGKEYDIRNLGGHGKDCLNRILPAIFEQMPLNQLKPLLDIRV